MRKPTATDVWTQAPPVLRTAGDVATACNRLAARCPHLAAALNRDGVPRRRHIPAGFAGLAHIVVGQQVSVASARAIWARFDAAVQPLSAAAFLSLDPAARAGIGLSAPKQRTLTQLSDAIVSGAFSPRGLSRLPDACVIARITALHGFGPWSADIYLMFALGRADAFAPGDLALQIAAAQVCGLPQRPDAADLLALAERWRPDRATAALLLWQAYAKR